MLPVINKPLLDFIIGELLNERPGMKKVVIAVNYRAREIEAAFRRCQKQLGCEIHGRRREKSPWGREAR